MDAAGENNEGQQSPGGDVEMDEFNRCMAKNDKEDVPLHLYFSASELEVTCEYEQNRLRNLYKNYHVMIDLGIPAIKPRFMTLSPGVNSPSKETENLVEEEVPYNLPGQLFPVPQPKGHQCDMCEVCFIAPEYLEQHRRHRHPHLYHTGKEQHACDQCTYKTNEESKLRAHQRVHRVERPYACDMCSKRFKHRATLTCHLRLHTGEQPYSCNTCGKSFTQSGSLAKHALIHTQVKMFMCRYCDKTFAQKAHLQSHTAIKHTEDYSYFCSLCDKGFVRRDTLATHYKNLHQMDPPHGCTVCSEKFVVKAHLQRHTAQCHQSSQPQPHTAQSSTDKQFKCIHCNKIFTKSSNMKYHVMTQHTKEYTIHCKVCKQGCSSASKLNIHTLRHHQALPHRCGLCGKSYTRAQTLKQHVIVQHSHEFPHRCSVCDKGFLRPGEMNDHMKKKHIS